ncbi:MAG: c-type heme family protein [Luteolibacter sp.]
MKLKYTWAALPAAAIALGSLSSCGKKEAEASTSGGYDAELVAEALYTVLKSDRKVYASKVVNRLVNEEGVIKAHEEWQEEKALLLPAQMFREGAEEVDASEKPFEFSYSLQSKWPLNMENAKKKTPAVEEGLDAVSDPDSEFYGKKWTSTETIAGTEYFVGIYPDRAVAPACWVCHNEHENRQESFPEFKKGDVMGGIVIRIPTGN